MATELLTFFMLPFCFKIFHIMTIKTELTEIAPIIQPKALANGGRTYDPTEVGL